MAKEPWPKRNTVEAPPRGSRPTDLVAQLMWYLARSAATDTATAVRTVFVFTAVFVAVTVLCCIGGWAVHLLANDHLNLKPIVGWAVSVFGSGLGVIGTGFAYRRVKGRMIRRKQAKQLEVKRLEAAAARQARREAAKQTRPQVGSRARPQAKSRAQPGSGKKKTTADKKGRRKKS
ncbi:hypothetical protein ACIA5C_45910 [Actinoplanes sp. NPDC051343]|uniref:hypothetical protein n=1 Tax=Actinoplanes sp. NPDC051343 TaxID=3363906 RepID=UPI0037B9D6C2